MTSPRSRPRRAALLILMMALTGPTLAACDRSSQPALDPVGAVLGSLQDRANAVITKAGTQGQILAVTAASQVGLAISNAESAFATDLDKSIDQVDDATRRTIDNLRVLLKDVESGSADMLRRATSNAQQLINSLPFANKNPQVTAYSPRFVTSAARDAVQVSVDGNFFWASHNKLEVSLRVGGETYKANESLTSRVGFSIPATAFGDAKDAVGRISMELTAPYEEGVVFKSRPVGVFHLLVTVLPAAPTKKVTLTSSVTESGKEYRSLTAPADGGGWNLRSWERCQDENDIHTISANIGWTIDVPSVQVGYSLRTPTDLDAWADLDTVGPTGFVVTGHTRAHCFLGISKGSGSLTYFVTYTEYRTTQTTTSKPRPLDQFTWGSQQVIPVSRGKWQVRAELWDGTVVESAGSSHDNPYLTIDDQGDHVKISVVAPTDLAK